MAIDENVANSYLLQIYAIFLLITYPNCKFSRGIQLLFVVARIFPLPPTLRAKDNDFCLQSCHHCQCGFQAMSEGLQKGYGGCGRADWFAFFFCWCFFT